MNYVIAEPRIDVLDRWTVFTDDNALFFTDPLPGRDRPVASPGGAGQIGRIGVGTALVAGYPPLGT